MHKPSNQFLIKFLMVLLTAGFLALDLSIPLGVAGGIPYTGVVLLSLLLPGYNYTWSVAVISTMLTVFGYYYSPDIGAIPWMVLVNRGLAIYAIWVTALLSIRIKFLYQKEVKTLSGLLPICAWCKNIRDDKGYWSQLEAYVSKHTSADFSHSICPDCMTEHYSELQQGARPPESSGSESSGSE